MTSLALGVNSATPPRKVTAIDCDRYVNSADYDRDLAAVHSIWSGPATPEIAGCFVFMTYLTLPSLLSVRRSGGASRMANSVLDGRSERLFLQRLLGLACDRAWTGGIRNARVRDMAATVSDQHATFSGMRQEYLDLIASLLSLAPLRFHDHSGRQDDPAILGWYWRYMRVAMSLMRADLGDEAHSYLLCSSYVTANSALTAESTQMIRAFSQRHLAYSRLALPILFPRSRSLVLPIIGESDV